MSSRVDRGIRRGVPDPARQGVPVPATGGDRRLGSGNCQPISARECGGLRGETESEGGDGCRRAAARGRRQGRLPPPHSALREGVRRRFGLHHHPQESQPSSRGDAWNPRSVSRQQDPGHSCGRSQRNRQRCGGRSHPFGRILRRLPGSGCALRSNDASTALVAGRDPDRSHLRSRSLVCEHGGRARNAGVRSRRHDDFLRLARKR